MEEWRRCSFGITPNAVERLLAHYRTSVIPLKTTPDGKPVPVVAVTPLEIVPPANVEEVMRDGLEMLLEAARTGFADADEAHRYQRVREELLRPFAEPAKAKGAME